jgi:hypothetical protein
LANKATLCLLHVHDIQLNDRIGDDIARDDGCTHKILLIIDIVVVVLIVIDVDAAGMVRWVYFDWGGTSVELFRTFLCTHL